MCLEEMYGADIKNGALFYISSHRKVQIELDTRKRTLVSEASKALKKMLVSHIIPQGVYSSKCVKCSMRDICMPKMTGSVSDYVKHLDMEDI